MDSSEILKIKKELSGFGFVSRFEFENITVLGVICTRLHIVIAV